jgi:hypothetical protein
MRVSFFLAIKKSPWPHPATPATVAAWQGVGTEKNKFMKNFK